MHSYLVSMALNSFKGPIPYCKMDGNKEIISRLKFIGKLKIHDKMNTKHMYVQPDGITTTISRTFFYPDNRQNAMTFVQETISRAFELLVTYDRSDKDSDKVLVIHLIKDLQQAKVGLIHLKNTYITDVKFCCDMDTLLEHIDAKLTNMYTKYPIIENVD